MHNIIVNEHTSNVFGGSQDSGFGFIKLGETFATKGFFVDTKSSSQEEIEKFVESVFESGDYKGLLSLAIEQSSINSLHENPEWVGYFGMVQDELHFSMCFQKEFTQTDVSMSLGLISDGLKTHAASMIGEFERSAIYQVGSSSKSIKEFFLSFEKKELNTLEKVQDKIKLFVRLENKLTGEDKLEVLTLSRRYCMTKKNAKKKPKRTWKQRLLFRKAKLIL